MNHAARLGRRATLDDIVLTVLPKLKNGVQPRKQKIIEELRKIAVPVEGKFWMIREEPQQIFDFAVPGFPVSTLPSKPRKPESDYEHNEILYVLAMLGQAAGFDCHIGKKEQTAAWGGQKFSDLSANELRLLRGAEPFTKEKVVQIDLIWLDAKRAAFAFEVEHSTSVSTGIDRFIELLRVDPSMAERIVIVAPRSRQRKMNQVLGSSHYIGAPMYMETKVRYLWYSDVLDIASQFENQQPTKGDVAAALVRALHIPRTKPA